MAARRRRGLDSESADRAIINAEDGEFAASFRAIAALALANKLPSIGAREYAVTMTVFLIDARHISARYTK
jgi:hypothetical protein